jgi:hypothetical protein
MKEQLCRKTHDGARRERTTGTIWYAPPRSAQTLLGDNLNMGSSSWPVARAIN